MAKKRSKRKTGKKAGKKTGKSSSSAGSRGKDFFKYMGIEERLQELVQQKKHGLGSVKDDSDKERRKIAYETLRDISYPGIDYSKDTAETLDERYVETGINLKAGMTREDASRIFSDNTENVLGSLKKASLEELALQEPVANKGEKGNSGLLSHYKEFLATKQLVEDYKEGNIDDPRKLQAIYATIAPIAEEDMKKRMKDRGYSRELQEMAGNIAYMAAENGKYNEDELKKTGDEMVSKAEKKFRDYESEKGKTIENFVKGAIKEMAKSRNAEEFETGKQLIYQASKKK